MFTASGCDEDVLRPEMPKKNFNPPGTAVQDGVLKNKPECNCNQD